MNSTNNTGTMKIDIVDEAIIPPKTAIPIVFLDSAPAPVANTSGNTPKMKDMDVIMIGRKRRRTASMVDCNSGSPRSTRNLANSTIRMAFFADKPINVMRPI